MSDDEEQQMEERRSLLATIEKEVADRVREAKGEFIEETAKVLKDMLILERGLDSRTTLLPVTAPTAGSKVRFQEFISVDGPDAAFKQVEPLVQEMIDESCREQFQQFTEVFREGFANVMTKRAAEQLSEDLRSAGMRISTLETGAEAKKEGLRGRIDRLNSKVNEELGELRERLREVEKVVYDEDEDDETDSKQELKRKAANPDDLVQHEERCLGYFRENMAAGLSVHLRGLTSRSELNDRAGVLLEWHEKSQRWSVLIGDEKILVKPVNIVP